MNFNENTIIDNEHCTFCKHGGKCGANSVRHGM